MWKKSEFRVLDKNFCIESMNRVIHCVTSKVLPRWLRAFNRDNGQKLTTKQTKLAHMVFASLGVTTGHSNRCLAEIFKNDKHDMANSNLEWFLAVVWNHYFHRNGITGEDDAREVFLNIKEGHTFTYVA